MEYSNSPAVDALENDFVAFFEFLTKSEEAPQIGGIGGVTPDGGTEVGREGFASRAGLQSRTNANARHDKQCSGVELMQ